jgi:ABC-2 type transport system permease protein
MNKVFAIIRREFIERVRTRSFLIGTILVPAIFAVLGVLPEILLKRETRTRKLVILDAAQGGIAARIDTALAGQRTGPDSIPRYAVVRIRVTDRLEEIRDSVVTTIGRRDRQSGAADGVLVLTDDAVETGRLVYLGADVTSFRHISNLERSLEPLLRDERLARRNADSALKVAAAIRLRMQTQKVTEGRVTGESGETSFLLAYAVDMFMYISLLLYGVQVLSSVIEEKTNKIVEVLISSVSPFELLLGKVLGVGAVGLLQLGIWSGTGFYLASMFRSGSGGVGGEEAVQAGFQMPTITADLIGVVLLFFLLGFFFYAALYAAVGSMCSTQQEAQQTATPVTMIIVLGMIFMFSLVNEPSGSLARVMTFIPFFTPLVVPVRYAISPLHPGEVLLGVVVMLLGIIAVVWVGARIYRVGILSYGKKPSLRELWRWVRTA